MQTNSVLVTTDGTYPCYPGGVSVWCDQLIRQLSHVNFHVFAIAYSPSHLPRFSRPANVLSQQVFPLWGTEEPGLQEENFPAALLRKRRTSDEAISSRFLEPFQLCLRSMLQPSSPPEEMANALVALHLYFREFDYAKSMCSLGAWETFLQVCCDLYPRHDRPSLEEAVTCLRWLQRYLAVAAVSFPETELVHASMAGLAGIPGVLQKLLLGSGFILSEHGIFLRELYLSIGRMKHSVRCRRFLFAWYETIARMNYHFADSVSSLCEFNRKWQIRVGADSTKIRIIPNGVDPAVFFPRPAAADGPPAPGPTVLTMARIYPLKGIDHLLRAARLVLDRIPSVRWRILGDVGDRQYHRHCLEVADRLGIAESIEWGQTSQPACAYRSADVSCLPSISEAMPYSVLEAMFSGCPVVATDVGGIAEMLAGTGLVVPPADADRMARAILSLIEGEGAASYRRDLAARALNRAQSLYTVEKCCSRFEEIYGQLSEDKKTASLSPAG